MKTVTLTANTTSTAFPVGTTFGGVMLKITTPTHDPVVSGLVAAAPYTQAFYQVEAGDYLAIAQAVDSNNQPLGAAFQTPFTVPSDGPSVNIDIPTGLSIAIS